MLLIVGQDSLIGNALLKEAASRGVPHAGTSRRPGAAYHLDLARPQSEWHLPDAVTSAVICAGIPGIAHCEENPEATRLINVDATISLADLLASKGAHVTFLSSNQVFHRMLRETPEESTPTSPANEYGRQKAEAERELLRVIPDSCVIRLTKVIHPGLPLFASWMCSLQGGQPITAFCDLFFSPVALSAAVDAIFRITESKSPGTFHLSAADSISYHHAALLLAARTGASLNLVRCDNAPYPCTPEASCLLCARLKTLDSRCVRSAQLNIAAMLEEAA